MIGASFTGFKQTFKKIVVKTVNELPTRIEIGGVRVLGQGFLTPLPAPKKTEKIMGRNVNVETILHNTNNNYYCESVFFPHLRIFLDSPVASLPAVPESQGQYCFHRKMKLKVNLVYVLYFGIYAEVYLQFSSVSGFRIMN